MLVELSEDQSLQLPHELVDVDPLVEVEVEPLADVEVPPEVVSVATATGIASLSESSFDAVAAGSELCAPVCKAMRSCQTSRLDFPVSG